MKCRLFFLLILLGGCTSPSTSLKEIHQRVVDQIALLVDSGYLQTQYIEVMERVSNDSSVIYSISASDSPASRTDELPSKVIKYKDKYFCFIKLEEPEMSRTELYEKGIVSDSTFWSNEYISDEGFWLLAIRKYENKHVLVKERAEYIGYVTEYPELWEYLSGSFQHGSPLSMALHSHNIAVADSLLFQLDDLVVDSLKHYIESFFGMIQLKNQTDSTIILSNNNLNDLSYAVVNGADTLRLILRDSLPAVIEPHGADFPRFDSESPHRFLQKLPEQDVWMSMYRLFCDSTFCFLKVNGVPTNFRILHDDTRFFNYMEVDSNARNLKLGNGRRVFYNKGVYDKDERGRKFRGW
ncbi:Imm65 family immunity protein [Bacteroides sp. f07]|uniref:Imm65 family immunity protein n=1 Tax=Bacteroides sp. f07 TaxID=3132704 RepID=UPI0034C2F3EC